MYRTDAPNSVAARPGPSALGTEGFFRDGVAGSFDGTVVDEDWLNMLQETIIDVLDDQSIAHSKTSLTGLTQAVASKIAADTPAIVIANVDAQALIPNPIASETVLGIVELATAAEASGASALLALCPSQFGQTLTRLSTFNGFWDVPGGLFRFQWGRFTSLSNQDLVTLPVAFNAGDGASWHCTEGNVSAENKMGHWQPFSATQARWEFQGSEVVTGSIFAIGRV